MYICYKVHVVQSLAEGIITYIPYRNNKVVTTLSHIEITRLLQPCMHCKKICVHVMQKFVTKLQLTYFQQIFV